MALIPSPDTYGFTLFCDDIRSEADGKISYVGSYGGHMFIHAAFPVTLPKFGFAIFLLQRETNFIPHVTLHVFLPGDPDDTPSIVAQMGEAAEGAVMASVAEVKGKVHPANKRPDDSPHIVMQSNLVMASLVIKQPGQIRVRCVLGDNTFRLGAMTVSPSPSAPPFIPAEVTN
jgi:hypothetical protein